MAVINVTMTTFNVIMTTMDVYTEHCQIKFINEIIKNDYNGINQQTYRLFRAITKKRSWPYQMTY